MGGRGRGKRTEKGMWIPLISDRSSDERRSVQVCLFPFSWNLQDCTQVNMLGVLSGRKLWKSTLTFLEHSRSSTHNPGDSVLMCNLQEEGLKKYNSVLSLLEYSRNSTEVHTT